MTFDNKEKWGNGPWVQDPDFEEFEYKGHKCQVIRSSVSGGLCGYVRLNPGNKYMGKHYDDIDIDCHGGLTFSGEDASHYFIGFDCAHSQDFSPKIEYRLSLIDPKYNELRRHLLGENIYRTIEYVKEECRNIVDQLIEKNDGDNIK